MLLMLATVLLAAGCSGSDSGQEGSGETQSGSPGSATSQQSGGETGAAGTGPGVPSIPAGSLTAPAPGVPAPSPGSPELPVPAPSPGGTPADVPAHLLDRIRADAAQRAGVAQDQVRVISSTAQTWNDGSLGCPQPGEGYIQVMIEGYQVLVQAGVRTFDYRTSQTDVRLCEKKY